MTPAEGEGKVAFLLAELERFKDLYEADAPLARVVPGVAARYAERYAGYSLTPALRRDAPLLSRAERQGAAAPELPLRIASRSRR